ncbi:transposable element Tc1 transposase [Trichonephila clavata]|uniref:Transposable element Tc1 transposase n=1 Tax=Trichonephila clavata TaxID=2740835 RepID=A0A8X6GI56_TRICU|nr:transposable element Tc1 transposase [Trichonephila clavata]
MDVTSVFFWTDSTIVLSWMTNESRYLNRFVANRVVIIQELTELNKWHQVPSEQNPADIISRGLDPEKIQLSGLWWFGDRFTEIRVIYEKNYNKHDESKSEISSEIAPDNLKLPKLSLNEYNLMPRSWIAFWGQFCRVHEDKNLRKEDKFQYLLSSLKSRTKARDIVESYPPSKGNYLKVIDHLKSRFGRKYLLIKVYIRDLLALVNNKSAIKLTDLYDKLGSDLRALETLNVTTSNYAAMLYPVVESCRPAEVLKAWDRHILN